MSPLDPRLRELLRHPIPVDPASELAPPGFAAAAVARWHREERATPPDFPDRILAVAAAASMAMILAGAALFLDRAVHPEPQPAWVSASQFAASHLMP